MEKHVEECNGQKNIKYKCSFKDVDVLHPICMAYFIRITVKSKEATSVWLRQVMYYLHKEVKVENNLIINKSNDKMV